jgi:hypothetical protein
VTDAMAEKPNPERLSDVPGLYDLCELRRVP